MYSIVGKTIINYYENDYKNFELLNQERIEFFLKIDTIFDKRRKQLFKN